MAALNALVQAAKESRGETEGGDHATVHDMPKKRAAKKTAAAAKKTAVRPRKRASFACLGDG